MREQGASGWGELGYDEQTGGTYFKPDVTPLPSGTDVEWAVVDNVTAGTVRTFNEEQNAVWLCRALNVQAGPGGRYRVRVA